MVRSESKSKGGRSGPLTAPGTFLGPQQLFRTVGGSELGRTPSGEAGGMGSEATEVATWARVSSLAWSGGLDSRLHWHSHMLLHRHGFSKRSTGKN